MYSESVPSVETMKNMSDKRIIKTLIVHEFEQIRHIDTDEDGIRNMKISQEFYDRLQKLTLGHLMNTLMMTMPLYLIFIKLNIINHQKLKRII